VEQPAAASYTQHNIQKTDVLPVPGDDISKTDTITGENIYPTATGAPVLIPTGRHVYNSDRASCSSPLGTIGFIAAFFQGDPIQPHRPGLRRPR